MATLLNFREVKLNLPDGRRATVSAVTPITSNDSFTIEPPIVDTHGASVVGFLEDSSSGGVISASNFYTGTTDTVRIRNRAGQNVIVVSLSANNGNYVPQRAS